MVRLFWIIWVGSKWYHKCPYKREVEGDLTTKEEKDNVTREAEIGVMWPQAEECQQTLEAERGKE